MLKLVKFKAVMTKHIGQFCARYPEELMILTDGNERIVSKVKVASHAVSLK